MIEVPFSDRKQIGQLQKQLRALREDYNRLRWQVEHQEGGIGDTEIRALVADRDRLFDHEEKYHASCACSPIRPSNPSLDGRTDDRRSGSQE